MRTTDERIQALPGHLRDLLDTLEVGDRLPSERDLATRWSVARMTLRRAVDSLVEEGRLERRHGSGTYVVQRPHARLLGLTSFTEDMRARGLVPGQRLVSFTELAATAGIASRLRIPEQSLVVRFTRVRLADDRPMALETVWIPRHYVPGLRMEDLDGSLYGLLASRFGIVTQGAHVALDPVLPDEATAALLEVPPSLPCLRVRMVDLDARQRTIMAADCHYRSDRYQLTAQLSSHAFAQNRLARPVPARGRGSA